MFLLSTYYRTSGLRNATHWTYFIPKCFGTEVPPPESYCNKHVQANLPI